MVAAAVRETPFFRRRLVGSRKLTSPSSFTEAITLSLLKLIDRDHDEEAQGLGDPLRHLEQVRRGAGGELDLLQPEKELAQVRRQLGEARGAGERCPVGVGIECGLERLPALRGKDPVDDAQHEQAQHLVGDRHVVEGIEDGEDDRVAEVPGGLEEQAGLPHLPGPEEREPMRRTRAQLLDRGLQARELSGPVAELTTDDRQGGLEHLATLQQCNLTML